MTLFQGFTGKVTSVEVFHPEITPQYNDFEWPAGYSDVLGNPVSFDYQKMRVITVMMGRGRLAKFVAEPEILAAVLHSETQIEGDEAPVVEPELKIIYAGAEIAAVGSPVTKKYVYYQKPLNKKYVMPRVMFGLKGAVISVVAGYILTLLAKHQEADLMRIVFEGITLLGFISSLIYAGYVYTAAGEAHHNMRLYIKKIL